LIRFEQIWLDLGKIKAKFGQNWSEIWAKVIRFGQIWLDLGKIDFVWANLIGFGQNQNFLFQKNIRSPTAMH